MYTEPTKKWASENGKADMVNPYPELENVVGTVYYTARMSKKPSWIEAQTSETKPRPFFYQHQKWIDDPALEKSFDAKTVELACNKGLASMKRPKSLWDPLTEDEVKSITWVPPTNPKAFRRLASCDDHSDQNSPARRLLAASGGRHHRRLVVLERLLEEIKRANQA